MDAKKARAKHDQQRKSPLIVEAPQSQTHGRRQPEHISDSSPLLHRYLGNSYMHAIASRKQQQSLQTKLKVNEAGDSYEREADRVADQVLATPAHHDFSGAPPRIQRFSGQSHAQVDAAPASVDQALASPGKPLEPALRQEMEARFGYDFAGVRVHSGTTAEQSAEDVNAHAYTVGHDIVLGSDRFGTDTHEGRRMIAHELTHVVQQSSVGRNDVAQSNEGRGFSPGLLSLPQPVAATVQRKAKHSPGDSSPKQAVKGKPSRQTSSNKVSFLIYFDKPLTRNEFIELADMTIYGRPTPGEWKGVPEHLKASDSPVVVWVPASTVESGLRAKIAALPPHIQNFLMKNVGSSEDLQSIANAGFILATAGVTEDELELSLLESPKTETSDLVSWALTFVERRGEGVLEVSETAAEQERQEKFREKIENLTPDAVRTEAAEVVNALGAPTLSDSQRRVLESNLQMLEEYASAQGFDLPEATAHRLRQVITSLAIDLGTLSSELKEISRTKVQEMGEQEVGEEKRPFSSVFYPLAVWALEQLSWATDALSEASGLTATAAAGSPQSTQQFRAAGTRVTAVLFTSQAVAIHLAYLHAGVVAASDFGNPFVNRKIASKVAMVREELEPMLNELRSFDPSRVERAVKELQSPWHGFGADFDSFVEELEEHAHTVKRVRQVVHIISLAMMARGLMLPRPGSGPPIAGGPGIGGVTAGGVAIARGAIGSVEWLEAMRRLVSIGAIATTGAAVGHIGGGTAGELPMPAKPTLTAASQGKPPGKGPVPQPQGAPSPEPAPSPPTQDPLAPAPGEAGRVELSGGGGGQRVGPTTGGEIGEVQQLANRIRTDPEFRQEYVERLRRANYTRERAQEIAGKYEREFAKNRGQDALTRATLWRLFADML